MSRTDISFFMYLIIKYKLTETKVKINLQGPKLNNESFLKNIFKIKAERKTSFCNTLTILYYHYSTPPQPPLPGWILSTLLSFYLFLSLLLGPPAPDLSPLILPCRIPVPTSSQPSSLLPMGSIRCLTGDWAGWAGPA